MGLGGPREHRRAADGPAEELPQAETRDGLRKWEAALTSHALAIIGCHGSPCDPATPWGDPAAEAAIGADGMGGAANLRLLRARDLAAVLTRILPPGELSVIGAALLEAAAGPAEQWVAHQTVLSLPSPILDKPVVLFPPADVGGDEPVPAPNPVALVLTDPAAKFEDLEPQLREFHERSRELAGITDGRFREDKIAEQLAAWDCRERWADGRYGSAEPLSQKAAAQQVRCSTSTFSGRHKQAFESITGTPHTPENYRDFHAVPRLLALPEAERAAFWSAMAVKVAASKAGEAIKRDALPGAVTETRLTGGGTDERRVDDETHDADAVVAVDFVAALKKLSVSKMSDDELTAAVTKLNGGDPPAIGGEELREKLIAAGANDDPGGGTG